MACLLDVKKRTSRTEASFGPLQDTVRSFRVSSLLVVVMAVGEIHCASAAEKSMQSMSRVQDNGVCMSYIHKHAVYMRSQQAQNLAQQDTLASQQSACPDVQCRWRYSTATTVAPVRLSSSSWRRHPWPGQLCGQQLSSGVYVMLCIRVHVYSS